MANTHVLCKATGAIVGLSCPAPERLAVAVNGDGVSTYDLSSQRLVQAWALGGPLHNFSTAAVYDSSSGRFFAALAPSATAKSRSSTVLAWPGSAEGGTLSKVATQLHLPAPVHSLHALQPPAKRQRQQEQQAGRQQHSQQQQAAQMDVDAGSQHQAAVAAVYTSGGVALCSESEVLSQVSGPAAPTSRTLAASLESDQLTIVHCDNASGSAAVSVSTVAGGRLGASRSTPLAPPPGGGRAVAAASTTDRTAVLWSDGTLAIYPSAPPGPGSNATIAGGGSNSSSGTQADGLPAVLTRRLAGLRLAAPKGKPAKTPGKKRGQATGGAGGHEGEAGFGATLAALDAGLLAVVGWSLEGAAALRVTVLDARFGCVQACEDLDCGRLGLGAPQPGCQLQVLRLPPGSDAGQLAVAVGGAVVLLDLPLRPPTLANLIGALALGGERPAAVAAATTSPCAAAAARALHPAELAAFSSAMGDGPRLVVPRFTPRLEPEAGANKAGGAAAAQQQRQLPLVECDFSWREVGAERLDEVESACSAALCDPGHSAHSSEPALLDLAQPLLELATKQGARLSPRLLARLLLLAAEKRWWGALAALLAAQHPGSLAGCPGLAAAVAQAQQYDLLRTLLVGAADLGSDELAEVLRALLTRPTADEGQLAQREYRRAAQQAAERLVLEAERAVAAHQVEAEAQRRQQQELQQQARQQQEELQQQQERQQADEAEGQEESEEESGEEEEEEEEQEEQQQQQLGQEQQHADVEEDEQQPQEVVQAVALAACAAGAVDGFTPAQMCLHPLLSSRHDAGVLLRALRQLSAAQAVTLLRYLLVLLCNLVGTVSDHVAAAAALPAELVLPHPLAAVAWAGAAIDANMSQLVLRPQATPVLQELQQLVGAQLAVLRRLAQLRGALQHVRSGAALPRPRGLASRYTVEWLDLRVTD